MLHLKLNTSVVAKSRRYCFGQSVQSCRKRRDGAQSFTVRMLQRLGYKVESTTSLSQFSREYACTLVALHERTCFGYSHSAGFLVLKQLPVQSPACYSLLSAAARVQVASGARSGLDQLLERLAGVYSLTLAHVADEEYAVFGTELGEKVRTCFVLPGSTHRPYKWRPAEGWFERARKPCKVSAEMPTSRSCWAVREVGANPIWEWGRRPASVENIKVMDLYYPLVQEIAVAIHQPKICRD